MSEIYDRIKARRIELGLTVEQLAALMGYKDKSSISKIENGKADIPQSKVAAFARALKTTTAYLVGIDEAKEAAPIPPGFQPMPEMSAVPLVGSIACGTPILAEQNIEARIGVPALWQADFALTCHGNSMAAMIQDGDIVCIRKQPEVENGEIAAVRHRRGGHPQALLPPGRHRHAPGREPRLLPAGLHPRPAQRDHHRGPRSRHLPRDMKGSKVCRFIRLSAV